VEVSKHFQKLPVLNRKMYEIIIDDIISCALNLIGHPDFSVAIKLYKNPATCHLPGLPVNSIDLINT